jgi:hypothetical protein
MLGSSMFLLAGIFYLSVYHNFTVEPLVEGQKLTVWVFQHFGYPIFLFAGAMVLMASGIKLLGAAGQTTATVIPDHDRDLLAPLILEANAKGIEQYVVLSSLSGFTGTFQKIGFTGLPLATVLVTLIFSLLSFANPEFLELAKLTLGAFIGSFVQKGRDAARLPEFKPIT